MDAITLGKVLSCINNDILSIIVPESWTPICILNALKITALRSLYEHFTLPKASFGLWYITFNSS